MDCTRTPWPGTTGCAAREPARSTRCGMRHPCSAGHRMHVLGNLARNAGAWELRLGLTPRYWTVKLTTATSGRLVLTPGRTSSLSNADIRLSGNCKPALRLEGGVLRS